MKYSRFSFFIIATLLVTLLFVWQGNVWAQEHPEHPQEHPSSAKKITKDELAKEIEKYVAKEAAMKGGYFLFYDAKENKPLALSLAKVHKDRLSRIKKDVYFACADFKATDGTMYDLDIFMQGKPGHLKATEITLHKKNGKARYKWFKEGDFWKRK